MKALVTGASGFIGHHVATVLIGAGHDVTVMHRVTSPTSNLDRLPARRITGDLLDEESIRKAVAGQDAVFHVAGLYSVWARRPADFRDINIEGTRRLLRAAVEAGVQRIVYTSTVSAVGGAKLGQIVDESATWNLGAMHDPYIDSKRRAEEVALEFAAMGAPVVVVNPTGPVGPGDLRPTPTGDLLVKFVNGDIPGYTDGGLNIVDVRDVARGHLLAHQHGRPGERYILGGANLTIADLMYVLARETGLPGPRIKIPRWIVFAASALLEGILGAALRRNPIMTRSNARMLRFCLHASSAKAERELGYVAHPIGPAIRDAIADLDRRGFLRPRRMKKVRQFWAQGDVPVA